MTTQALTPQETKAALVALIEDQIKAELNRQSEQVAGGGKSDMTKVNGLFDMLAEVESRKIA